MIPRGATIESARLTFSVDEVHTPAGQLPTQANGYEGSSAADDCDPTLAVGQSGTHCSTQPVVVDIVAHSSDNAEEFVEEDNNLSKREP